MYESSLPVITSWLSGKTEIPDMHFSWPFLEHLIDLTRLMGNYFSYEKPHTNHSWLLLFRKAMVKQCWISRRTWHVNLLPLKKSFFFPLESSADRCVIADSSKWEIKWWLKQREATGSITGGRRQYKAVSGLSGIFLLKGKHLHSQHPCVFAGNERFHSEDTHMLQRNPRAPVWMCSHQSECCSFINTLRMWVCGSNGTA